MTRRLHSYVTLFATHLHVHLQWDTVATSCRKLPYARVQAQKSIFMEVFLALWDFLWENLSQRNLKLCQHSGTATQLEKQTNAQQAIKNGLCRLESVRKEHL